VQAAAGAVAAEHGVAAGLPCAAAAAVADERPHAAGAAAVADERPHAAVAAAAVAAIS